jgi:hypothetical protein
MNKNYLFIIGFILAGLLLIFGTDKLYTVLVDNSVSADGNTTFPQSEESSPSNIKTAPIINNNVPRPAYEISGFDWSLPKGTTAEENSGLIDEYDRGLDFAQNVFAIVRWDEANPHRGQYDFSKFEKYLANVSPKKSLVRLEVNSICEAPKWAQKNLRSTPDKSLIFWDKSYINLLEPFVKAFAKRYANDLRIIGVQLGIADGEYRNNSCDFSNKDGWGEFWMSPKSIATAQRQYGFTPDVFEEQTKKIIDVYTNAFSNNLGKLAFTNIGPTFSWTNIAAPYNKKLKNIAQYVWKSGIGNRDGNVEIWMRYIDKAYGVQLRSLPDGSCFLDYDEDYADIIRGRYSGTENEFYGDKDYVIEANGPYKNQPYRFMLSSLRALQMRRNYMSIAGDSMALIKDPIYKTQSFLSYLNKVLGKQIENTPDAFIILGERYVAPSRLEGFTNEPCVKNAKKGAAIRSFGRWLTEKSDSKPALSVSMPESENYWGQDYTMPYGVDFEFSARESKKFEFDINDKLMEKRCQKGCDIEVKTTYKDTAITTLNIAYGNNKLQSFKTKGDNKIKTITFSVNSHFKNINQKLVSTDFTISSKVTVPLIMIRVNFL